jgi:hypothetical protein
MLQATPKTNDSARTLLSIDTHHHSKPQHPALALMYLTGKPSSAFSAVTVFFTPSISAFLL